MLKREENVKHIQHFFGLYFKFVSLDLWFPGVKVNKEMKKIFLFCNIFFRILTGLPSNFFANLSNGMKNWKVAKERKFCKKNWRDQSKLKGTVVVVSSEHSI